MSDLEMLRQLARLERRIGLLETGRPVPSTSGWTNAIEETWTYASAATFTVAEDVTDRYQVGDAVRFKQGGAFLHGRIVSVTYSSPNSTVTIFGDTIAAATITDNYYSKALSPQGIPVSGLILDMDTVAATGSTTSTNTAGYDDLDSMSVTVTVPADGNVELLATIRHTNSNAGNSNYLRFFEGATALGEEWVERLSSAGYYIVTTFHLPLTGVSAGSHTYKIGFHPSANTMTVAARRMTAKAW